MSCPRVPGLVLALVVAALLVACGDASSARSDADLGPYFRTCSVDQACPDPYTCTAVVDGHDPDAGPRDVCLVPCEAAGDCSFHFSCCCKGAVDCNADVGKDGFCVCI